MTNKIVITAENDEMANEKLSSTTIDIAELGETATIIGSARIVESEYWDKIKTLSRKCKSLKI